MESSSFSNFLIQLFSSQPAWGHSQEYLVFMNKLTIKRAARLANVI